MERGLSTYHPFVSFLYFSVVIIASMLFMHPIFVFISFICSICYSMKLNREKTIKILSFTLLMIFSIAIVNALFVNRGVSVIFYFRDNPVTFESFMYGITSGIMMASIIMWFNCYNEIITTEKFLYIFGKILPQIALIASMTLRLIPKLIKQAKTITSSQRAIGFDYTQGSVKSRIKSSMRILSILVTWTLEDAVYTADSMVSRGYGLKGRSNFSIFIFIKRDFVMIIFILIGAISLIIAYMLGYTNQVFYPVIIPAKTNISSILFYLLYLILAILPTVIELMEERKWKCLD